MTSLTIIKCDTHTPQMSAISYTSNMCWEEQFTFCTTCEQNIERVGDIACKWSWWSNWKVSN